VVVRLETQVRSLIAGAMVKSLGQPSQDFYNGPSCFVVVQKEQDVAELLKVLKALIKWRFGVKPSSRSSG